MKQLTHDAPNLQVGGAALAVVRDAPNSGVFFGPDGLHIPLAPGKERQARCKLGPLYARMPDGGNCLFAAGESAKNTQLVGLRVYVAEGPGEPRLHACCGSDGKGACAGCAAVRSWPQHAAGCGRIFCSGCMGAAGPLRCRVGFPGPAGEQWELDGIVWKTS